MYWDYNMKIIKEEYPTYVELLNESKLDTKTSLKFERVEYDEQINLRVIGEDFNVYLHSIYSPKKEAEKMDALNEINDIIILFGAGLFYHVEYFSEKYPDKLIICIESQSDMFLEAMSLRPLDILKNEKISFLLSDDMYSISHVMIDYIKNYGYQEFSIVTLPSYYIFDNYNLNDYLDKFKGELQFSIINMHTELFFIKEWTANQVDNYKTIVKEKHAILNSIFNKEFNFPTVIVGAGPSLGKNIEILKKYENKVMIIAAGSSINILKRHNIVPDICVVLDGGTKENYIIRDVPENSILCYYATVASEGIKKSRAYKTYFLGNDSNFFAAEKYEEIYNFPTVSLGPSCVNVATDIAVKLGVKDIVFIGQDMAYTDKLLYAEGAALFDEVHEDKRTKLIKTDIWGNEIETNNAFITIKRYFDLYVERASNEVTFVNCTEGGLGIEGVPNLTLESTLNAYDDIELDIKKEMISQLTKFNESQYFFHNNDELIEYKNEITTIKELSEKRLKIIKNVLDNFERLSLQRIRKFSNEITDITDELDQFWLNTTLIHKRLSVMDMLTRNKVNTEIRTIIDIKDKYKFMLEQMMSYYDYYNVVTTIAYDKFMED